MSTTTTKTAATTTKVVKAGGAKGERIVEVIKADKTLTRRQVAEAAGATVGRVGEVVRWLAANGTAAEKKAVAHLVAKPATPKTEAKPAAKRATKTTTVKATEDNG